MCAAHNLLALDSDWLSPPDVTDHGSSADALGGEAGSDVDTQYMTLMGPGVPVWTLLSLFLSLCSPLCYPVLSIVLLSRALLCRIFCVPVALPPRPPCAVILVQVCFVFACRVFVAVGAVGGAVWPRSALLRRRFVGLLV